MQKYIAYAQANWWDTGLIIRWSIAVVAGLFYGVSGVIVGGMLDDSSPTTILVLFGALMLPIALVLVGQPLKRWFLGIIIVDLAVQYDFNLGWDGFYGEQGTVAGIIISLTTFSLIGLYGLWLMELMMTRRMTPTRPSFRYAAPLVAFIGAGVISIIGATSSKFVWYELALLVQMLLLFVYIAGTVRKREDVIFIVAVMLGTMAFEGLYHLWQRFGPSYAGIRAYRGTDGVYSIRVDGHFRSPNLAGAFFSFFLVPSLAFMMLPHIHRYLRYLAMFAFAMGGLGIFLTFSRGAWVAFALSATVFIGIMVIRGWLSLSVPMMLAFAFLVLMLLFPELLLERLFGDDGGAASGRIPLNIIAIEMAESNPLTGVGLNNFATVLPDYLPLDFANEWLFTVHNKYLLVLSETGALGLLAFLWFLLLTIWRGFMVWLKGEKFYAILGLALMAVVTGHLFHLNVEVFNGRPGVQVLWMTAALISALHAIAVNKEGLDDGGQHVTD